MAFACGGLIVIGEYSGDYEWLLTRAGRRMKASPPSGRAGGVAIDSRRDARNDTMSHNNVTLFFKSLLHAA